MYSKIQIYKSKNKLVLLQERSPNLTLEDLGKGLPVRWQKAAAFFGSSKRQKEYLAVRRLLYDVLGDVRLTYLESGQPMIQSADYQHIAISHTANYAAVFLHRHQKVGIDIELISPKTERIKERFLNPSELSWLTTKKARKLFYYTLYWSAKESLYKYFGQKDLHFKKQLHIFNIFEKSALNGQLSAIIYDKKGLEVQQIKVYYQVIGTHILTYCSA